MSCPNFFYLLGDIFHFKFDCIVQQGNCTSTYAKGLAKDTMELYPYSNIYKLRTKNNYNSLATLASRDIPGSIRTCFPLKDGPIVIYLMAQYYPGKANRCVTYSENICDSSDDRITWFAQSLLQLVEVIKICKWKTLGIPNGIGCGLAGGKWEIYLSLLTQFALQVPETTIYLVNKNG